ncbi:hypothetical protein E0Z10_g3602 [Xylaria hypoxylon]|uniref:Aminoglycoside phosphotransferase domain-containing protein n=1 Tax=Xylaria hypoxylon TaxID=37992 RepID=A0A4Z0Z723_9PEZI|nr:hypothetical protein E0Z10_g3602 [Xylaria hypoxylon]
MFVVRVGEHFIAKYGANIRSIEGENMLFVKNHTTIPVPEVYAMYTFGEGNTMIIMEFIRGTTLQRYLRTQGWQECNAVSKELRAQVQELQRIPAPPYYGALGRRPIVDAYRSRELGPFDTSVEFVNATFDIMFSHRSSQRFADIKKFFSISLNTVATALGHTHPVFTHGDIHEDNIIVREDGMPVLIDYEMSGFYPAFQEGLVAERLDAEIDFIDDKFDEERQIITDAHEAWVNAEIEEPSSENEESDSDDSQ